MFKQVAKQCAVQASRKFSSTRPNNFQVTVCGASGGIGQPLSLLLKLNPLVTRLNLYDIVGTVGVAADLSHIDTKSEVVGFVGQDKCGDSLKCSDVVLIAAGVPRKPGMTRDDLFDVNASIVKQISQDITTHCPNAITCVLTNPINSMLPIAAEVFKKANVFKPKRLFGVTTLDLVRSRKFIGETLKIDPQKVKIDVICGHSGVTIIPLFSCCEPKYDQDVEQTMKRIQTAGDEVLKAKAGAGTATLSMAYSAATFASSLLKALNGETNIIECAFVQSDECHTEYFAMPILLGKEGIEKYCGVPQLNDFEKETLVNAIPVLKANIMNLEKNEASDVVIISAGIPRKPGMTRDDLFNTNAGIVRDIIEQASKNCPKALIAIITNPVNTLVPIAAEILKKNGVYDPKRLFGVTTLDVVRARAFVGHELGKDPQDVSVPVIGGHSGVTIMPIFSQSKPKYDKNIDALTKRVQDAGTEVVKAKAGGGSATLSMAYAGALFGKALLRGLNGESNVVECAYVQSDVTETAFFSTPILLGKNGVEKNLGLPSLSDYEKKVLAEAIPELKKNIDKGIKFGKN